MKENESKEDQVLARMAEAINEGIPVDWPAERKAHRGLAHRLEKLQHIEDVALAYRGVLSTSGNGDEKRSPGDTPNSPRNLRSTEPSRRMPANTRPAPPTGTAPTAHAQPPAANAPQTEPAPLTAWGPLLILEKIGEGSFAEVYRAYDPTLKRAVALKLRRGKFSPDHPSVEKFLDEARRLASIRHQHVVAVHGADLHDGRVGLWTDLVRGETLEQAVKDRGPFGAHEAACIGIDLCCALSSLHATGLIHRDIKPSNVMREQGGNIVLMDFGSSIELQEDRDQRVILSGTPLTMAPEVLIHGESPQPAVDIYGLGVLLYWLVSGRYPVEARDMAELVEKHERAESMPLLDARSDLPVGFAQVVERALAKDPSQRFASAGEMQRALCTALGTIPATEPQPIKRPHILRVVAPLAAVLVLMGAYVVYEWLRPKPLDARAALFRLSGTTEIRVLPGGHVQVGEQLFLEIEGSRSMYVYVLNADERGEAYVLLDPDPKSPLAGGMKHRLPGMREGLERHWIVSSEGGRETIFAIASRKRLPELEKMIAGWPRAMEGSVPLQSQTSVSSTTSSLDGPTRGIGMLEPWKITPASRDSLLPNLIRALLGNESKSRGIWFWQIHLLNDGSR